MESERYEHAKTKLSLMETKDKNNNLCKEIEFLKSELDKERKAYMNVFSLLKDKALNESTKSIDLIEKIAHTEVRYNDAVQDMVEKEKRFSEMWGKIKQKEKSYEQKVHEMNLKIEQDKYINRLLDNQSNTKLKPKKKK